jgi:hypothetical protein
VWEHQLDVSSFALRCGEAEAELAGLPDRLAALPARQLAALQRRLRAVWQRYAYTGHPLLWRELQVGRGWAKGVDECEGEGRGAEGMQGRVERGAEERSALGRGVQRGRGLRGVPV